MTFQLTTLASGLRVATEYMPSVETVAVVASCGVGARYESEAENGISHLLEHMAFKGTKTRSAQDIAEAFDAIGGQVNAYTSMEHTVYFAKVLKDDVRLAVDILGDILQNSTFLEEELAREKDVIIQEIAMHRDTPDDLLVDYFDETMFPSQPLGRSILSTEAKIAATTRDDVIRYMHTHYNPPRIVLSAAGAVDHAEFVSLAEEFFDLPARAAGPDHVIAHYVGGDRREKSDLEQLHLALGLPGVAMHSPDFYVMQLYASILGGGMSSRLFQEVRERRGLAYSVYAMGSAYADVGVLSIYAATSPDKGGELSLVLCDELRRMADSITDAELQRAKNQMKAELIMSRENPQNIASWIGRHLLNYGEYRQMPRLRERIDAVTTRDISRFASVLLSGTPTLTALGDISAVADYAVLKQRLA